MDYLHIIKNNEPLQNDINQLCDFCLDLSKPDISYYGHPANKYTIFGTDASGGLFGFIGEGDTTTLPIGYVSSEGEAGKIAANITDFFHLITFYPYWRDLCTAKNINNEKWIAKLEKEGRDFNENYEHMQTSIASRLDLYKNDYTRSQLHAALTDEPKFIFYSPEDNRPYEDLFIS